MNLLTCIEDVKLNINIKTIRKTKTARSIDDINLIQKPTVS